MSAQPLVASCRWADLDRAARADLLRRPNAATQGDLDQRVRALLDDVRLRGDAAVLELTERFDGVHVESLAVTEAEFAEAETRVAPEVRAAMIEARERLLVWHRAGHGRGVPNRHRLRCLLRPDPARHPARRPLRARGIGAAPFDGLDAGRARESRGV
jgi:hypothetical protein